MSGPRRRRTALLVTFGRQAPMSDVEETLRRLRAALRAGDDVAADAGIVAGFSVYRPGRRIRLTDTDRHRWR